MFFFTLFLTQQCFYQVIHMKTFLTMYCLSLSLFLRLSLLWYHTILRPFFALDGEQEDAGKSSHIIIFCQLASFFYCTHNTFTAILYCTGAEEALRLLREVESQYNDSAFFLYFHGKVHYLRVRQSHDYHMPHSIK